MNITVVDSLPNYNKLPVLLNMRWIG